MKNVWLHGAALSGARFGPEPEGIWLDLPGHGTAPRAEPTVASYAEVIKPQLPDAFCLIGHSLGGMVSMQIAADMPERCRAIVLVDAALRIPFWVLRRFGPASASGFARLAGAKRIAAVVAQRVENPAARPAVRQAIASMSHGGLTDCMIAPARFEGAPLLTRIKQPMLVLHGKRSILTGAGQRAEIRRACPQAEIHVMDAGHTPQFDQPEAFDTLVTLFLQKHG